ncbi:MAG TPA: hypothetical protein VMY42_12810 [Thermoguttaceae bacterium]|nr:hypothetical protein [Thermoguttaceae bacterium]
MRVCSETEIPLPGGTVAIRQTSGYPFGGKVKLPRGWWVDYRVGDGDWQRMKKYVTDDFGLERDQFNVVRPDAPLRCDAISIRILPQVGYCMGVHEIQVEFEP